MSRERIKEILRFGAVGIGATALHYGIYYVLLRWLNHNVAYTVGFVVSFVCNYVASSWFTFRVKTSLQRFVGFGMSHLTNYFVQMVLLNLFIFMGLAASVAPLPVYVLAVPINYLLVRTALTRNGNAGDGYVLTLMSVGFAMLWLNLMDAPTLSDDMIYRFIWSSDESQPVQVISGVGDLLRSQCVHYIYNNGRFVVHLLAQAFLVFVPPVVLQVLNTLLFVLLIHLSTQWVVGPVSERDKAMGAAREREKIFVSIVSCFLLFVVFQGFRTAMVWGLGAFNYLWVLVGVLALLLWLRRVDGRHVSAFHLLLAPLALLAGWSHEALSLPVSVTFVAFLFVNRNRCLRMAVTPYMLWFMAGTVLCLLSPGIWSRGAGDISLQGRMLSGVINLVFNLRVFWILAIVLLLLWWRDSRRRADVCTAGEYPEQRIVKQFIIAQGYVFVALAVALAIVLFCGTNLERVGFFVDFMSMLLLCRLLLNSLLLNSSLLNSSQVKCIELSCCVIMVLCYVPACMVRSANSDNWRQAERQMEEAGGEVISVRVPLKGDNVLMDYFRGHYVNSSIDFGFYCSYMAFDSNDINMRCAAKLYGKERLTLLPEDVVQRIEADSTAYTDYELDRSQSLYIWRLARQASGHDKEDVTLRSGTQYDVDGVRFVLRDEDPSQLLPHQRLVAYKGNEYELDDFKYEVVTVCGRQYLVFTRPTTNIFRRIEKIEKNETMKDF